MNTELQTPAAKAISIEQEVENIFKLLTSNTAENTVVVKERAPEGKACKAFIYAYKRSDLIRQKREEAEYQEYLRQGYDKAYIAKPFLAKPTIIYAFYPSIENPSKLGSIAIYGIDVASIYLLISKRRSLFGHAIARVSFEKGIRPFVDVKLRPQTATTQG